jgi:hypothetical protein
LGSCPIEAGHVNLWKVLFTEEGDERKRKKGKRIWKEEEAKFWGHAKFQNLNFQVILYL